MATLRKIISSFHISWNTNPSLTTESASRFCWSPYIHVMLQKKWELGRIRVRCRYLLHNINKSQYKTNPFYDWLFQIVYICHCADDLTLIPMSCFPNDIFNHTQHTFMMDRDFIKGKRLVSAGLYHCYCITNVQCRTVPLLLHHKCTVQDCTTVTASQMYNARLYHCYCITNVQCKTVPLLLHHKCTVQDCTTVTASQMYSAGLYHCYCITNVQCKTVPLLLHHKCTVQNCTTVTASQMYPADCSSL